MALTHEEVLPLLPELAEGELHAAGEVEVHLASCPSCSAELQAYRTLILALGDLREDADDPGPEFLDRLIEQVPAMRRRALLGRVTADERVHYAAFSLGGAVVGATAVALLWRRARHRPPFATAAAR